MRALLFFASLALVACNSGIGDTCKTNSDCSHYDLGYCARARLCTRPCGVDTPTDPDHKFSSDCPSDAACVQEGPRLVCLKVCKTSKDCGEHYICTDEGTAKVCELASPLAKPPG